MVIPVTSAQQYFWPQLRTEYISFFMQAMAVGLERIHGDLIGGVFIGSSEYAVVVCEWASRVNGGVCVSEGGKQMIF